MDITFGFGAAVRAMANRAAVARRQRQTDRMLANLPRHLLRDIGFDRSHYGVIARTPRD